MAESQVHSISHLSRVIHKTLQNLFPYYWHHLLFLFNMDTNSVLQKFEVKPNLNSSQQQRFTIICAVAVFAGRSSCLLPFPHKAKAGASPGSEDVIVERWKQTTGTTPGSSELALSTPSAQESLQETSLHQADLRATGHSFLGVMGKVTQAGFREGSEGLGEGWGKQR